MSRPALPAWTLHRRACRQCAAWYDAPQSAGHRPCTTGRLGKAPGKIGELLDECWAELLQGITGLDLDDGHRAYLMAQFPRSSS